MKQITVLFDASCGLCQNATRWLESQPKFVPLDFMAQQDPERSARFPGLRVAYDESQRPEELVAIDDQGGVYRSTDAYLIILWALRDYRGLSRTLASPALRPLVRRAFHRVTQHRHRLSKLFGTAQEQELHQTLLKTPEPMRCHNASADASD